MCKKVSYSLANHYDLPAFVMNSQVTRVQELCQAVRQTKTLGMVLGQPGVGKTWAVRHTVMRQPDPENGMSSPVLYISADVGGQLRNLLVNLLTALGPDYRAPVVDMTRMVCSWIHRRMTRLIIIDDADRLNKACLLLICDIHERTGCAFVFVAEPGFGQRIRRYAKLTNSVSLSIEMNPLTYDELGPFLSNWLVQRARNNDDLSRGWPRFGASEPEIRQELYRVTLGNLRRVFQFVAQAERVAQVNGNWSVNLANAKAIAHLFANQQLAP